MDDKIIKPGLSQTLNVHVYHENWVINSKELDSNGHLKFQKSCDLLMIRSSSEAILETIGSVA